MNITRILVPTDFSANSRAAIEPARVLAERFGAHIDLVHVWESLPLGVPEWNALGPDGSPVAARVFLKRLAEQEMDKLTRELREQGMTVHGRLEEGNVWRTVTRLAAEEHYDLIVVSTHGRTGVERLVMGSIAEQIVRHAPCGVYVVHPELPAGGR